MRWGRGNWREMRIYLFFIIFYGNIYDCMKGVVIFFFIFLSWNREMFWCLFVYGGCIFIWFWFIIFIVVFFIIFFIIVVVGIFFVRVIFENYVWVFVWRYEIEIFVFVFSEFDIDVFGDWGIVGIVFIGDIVVFRLFRVIRVVYGFFELSVVILNYCRMVYLWEEFYFF